MQLTHTHTHTHVSAETFTYLFSVFICFIKAYEAAARELERMTRPFPDETTYMMKVIRDNVHIWDKAEPGLVN